MKTRGNYTIEEDNYNLNISYEYYWDDGDHENAPENDLEILEVELNGVDITDFFWDWVNDNRQNHRFNGRLHRSKRRSKQVKT